MSQIQTKSTVFLHFFWALGPDRYGTPFLLQLSSKNHIFLHLSLCFLCFFCSFLDLNFILVELFLSVFCACFVHISSPCSFLLRRCRGSDFRREPDLPQNSEFDGQVEFTAKTTAMY